MTTLSFKQVECNYGIEESCKRGCSWIIDFFVVWIWDTVNMVLLSFQLEFKMAVHAALARKKICEVNNFWGFSKEELISFWCFFKKS